jgi:hypothetical protein
MLATIGHAGSCFWKPRPAGVFLIDLKLPPRPRKRTPAAGIAETHRRRHHERRHLRNRRRQRSLALQLGSSSLVAPSASALGVLSN